MFISSRKDIGSIIRQSRELLFSIMSGDPDVINYLSVGIPVHFVDGKVVYRTNELHVSDSVPYEYNGKGVWKVILSDINLYKENEILEWVSGVHIFWDEDFSDISINEMNIKDVHLPDVCVSYLDMAKVFREVTSEYTSLLDGLNTKGLNGYAGLYDDEDFGCISFGCMEGCEEYVMKLLGSVPVHSVVMDCKTPSRVFYKESSVPGERMLFISD